MEAFTAFPSAELAALIPDFEWGLDAAIATARWVAGFEFPEFDSAGPFVALVGENEYPMNEGRLGIGPERTISVTQYEQEFREFQVPHSTALHSRLAADDRSYLVGPLARVALNRQRLAPVALQTADDIGLPPACRNPFKSILARAVEVVHVFAEALDILRGFSPFGPPRAEYRHRAGSGSAATEAPRGTLYHRLECDDAGRITFAKIVPPTSQNQAQIEHDLKSYIPRWLGGTDAAAAVACERLVRSYDPCISCSTHFLKTTIQRD